jgi:hypothetical protein
MTPDTLLLRQIHPSFIREQRVLSSAFCPTSKDEHLFSVDNGDSITPKDSWAHFIGNKNCHSIGVLAVSKNECDMEELVVVEDGKPYPEHCSIDFSELTRRQSENKAKSLRSLTVTRGWLFQADGN